MHRSTNGRTTGRDDHFRQAPVGTNMTAKKIDSSDSSCRVRSKTLATASWICKTRQKGSSGQLGKGREAAGRIKRAREELRVGTSLSGEPPNQASRLPCATIKVSALLHGRYAATEIASTRQAIEVELRTDRRYQTRHFTRLPVRPRAFLRYITFGRALLANCWDPAISGR